VIAILLGFVSVPLMTRHLGPEEYGRFVTVLSLIGIVSLLANGGIARVGIREYVAREPARRRTVLRSTLGLRLLLSSAAVILALAFAAANYRPLLVLGTLLLGVAALLGDLRTVYVIPLMAALRLGTVSVLELCQQIVLVTLVVVLVAVGAGLLPFFAAVAIAAGVALVGTVVLTRADAGGLPTFGWDEWRALFGRAMPYAVAVAVGGVSFRLTVILMSLVATEAQTGYYAVPFRIFEVLVGIATVLVSSAFPILARIAPRDPARLRGALQSTFEVVTIIGVGAAVLTAVGAELAIAILAGPEYAPAVPVLRIAAAAIAFAFLFITWEAALLAVRLHGALLATSLVTLAVAAVTPVLIEAYGAKGAAAALVAIELVGMCTGGLLLTRARPDLRVSLRVVPRVAAAAAAAGIGGTLVLRSAPDVVAVVIAAALYVAGLALLKGIPSALRDIVLDGLTAFRFRARR
jgi:O-antigen/teichoic acid export membrane protein